MNLLSVKPFLVSTFVVLGIALVNKSAALRDFIFRPNLPLTQALRSILDRLKQILENPMEVSNPVSKRVFSTTGSKG